MSKSNEKVPVLGQPVFVIIEGTLDKKVGIVDDYGFATTLRYFAHDAILVRSQRYTDDSLRKIVINEGMKSAEDETKSLELLLDLDKNFSRENDGNTIFIDESDAAAVAKKMNENEKKKCGKIRDSVNKAYNTYDDVIAACILK
jgi:predicted NACHT family NTPase